MTHRDGKVEELGSGAIAIVGDWLAHGRNSFRDTIPLKALDDVLTLARAAESLAVTVRRIYAERLPDTWFVCGESTVKDGNGLPDHIHVCPAYGADFSVIYARCDAQVDRSPKADGKVEG